MKIILGVLLLWSFAGNRAVSHKDSMESFKWMLGDWQSQRKSGIMQESWKQINDSSFEGVSVIINQAGDKKILEEMQLLYRMKAFQFISAVPGQNNEQPVSFAIQKYSEKHFTAENPAHDFPKRITYELIKADSLHAWIDGGPQNPDQKVDFYFTRQKN